MVVVLLSSAGRNASQITDELCGDFFNKLFYSATRVLDRPKSTQRFLS
jgi:hypothetical protein